MPIPSVHNSVYVHPDESAVTSGHNLSASTSLLMDRNSNNKQDVNSGNTRASRAQKTNNGDREMNDGHSLALALSKSCHQPLGNRGWIEEDGGEKWRISTLPPLEEKFSIMVAIFHPLIPCPGKFSYPIPAFHRIFLYFTPVTDDIKKFFSMSIC